MNTSTVFIVGSGRCGTQALAKAYEDVSDLEFHHEYQFEYILRPAVMYNLGRLSENEAIETIRNCHVSAAYYSRKKTWVDCSNALPWIVGPLAKAFPEAKFIHLVRDGRKVVSSFYNKFAKVMFDDRCVEDLVNWVRDPEGQPVPPPEKKYWRPVKDIGNDNFESYLRLNRFQKLCHYWVDVNQVALDEFEKIPNHQKAIFRLEELISDQNKFSELSKMVGVENSEGIFAKMERPYNVAIPKNFRLTDQQTREFEEIAGPMMDKLGYSQKEEYDVTY